MVTKRGWIVVDLARLVQVALMGSRMVTKRGWIVVDLARLAKVWRMRSLICLQASIRTAGDCTRGGAPPGPPPPPPSSSNVGG